MSNEIGRLIWIDLEMTGLDPQRDSIIEIATIVTDARHNVETAVEHGRSLLQKSQDTLKTAWDTGKEAMQHSQEALREKG